MARTPPATDGVSLSPDGSRVATSFGEAPIRDIWVFDIARRNSIRVTFNGDNDYAVWSPDGRRVAFAANQAGTYDVLARAVDGSGAVDTLASGDPYQFPGGWTPDGRAFVYRQNDAKTNEDLYAVSLDGRRTIRTLNASPFTEIEPALSPDGQWLAYVSDETGRREVYVRSMTGDGGKTPVSANGGDEPRWARSGRELYYRTSDSLFAVPITSGRTFTTGKPVALFADHYERNLRFQNYDVLPSGAGFVMLQNASGLADAATELRLVVNWPALLSAPSAR